MPPLRRRGLLHHGLHAGQRGHVAGKAEGAVADFLGGGFRLIAVAGDDRHLGARLREDAGDALADALGAAGDDDGAALEAIVS